MDLDETGQEYNRPYIRDMRPTPIEPEFTFDYFCVLIDTLTQAGKRSVKGLLTQDQLIPGLGNATAQDILFRAKLHPRHPIDDLNEGQRRQLYRAILKTVGEVIEQGGRYDEYDLYNHPGGYIRIMDKNTVGHPCPVCSQEIEKIQYLGGSCYFCPNCQR
jgi:formamidopyrimidine-DNA glycosylase